MSRDQYATRMSIRELLKPVPGRPWYKPDLKTIARIKEDERKEQRVRYKVVKIAIKYLKPGDLYSTVGTEYWHSATHRDDRVYETVNVRSNGPLSFPDEEVFKLTIERIDGEGQLVEKRKMDPYRIPGVIR